MNVATSKAVISRFGSPLVDCDASAAGCAVVAVCADSVYVVFLIGTSAHSWRRTRDSTPDLGMSEPSRNGAAEGRSAYGDRLARRTRWAGLRARRSTRVRIVAGPEGDAWRMCARHRTPNDRAERHLVPRSR